MLPVTELISPTSDMVSSIHKTNKRVDHKGPELTGVVMLRFAGQTVLSSMEGECPKCSSLLSHADLPQAVQYKLGPLELGLAGWLLPIVPRRLSRRSSGGTAGRTGVTGCLLLGPCLFSLGLVHMSVFMECFDHGQIVCQQCSNREFAN